MSTRYTFCSTRYIIIWYIYITSRIVYKECSYTLIIYLVFDIQYRLKHSLLLSTSVKVTTPSSVYIAVQQVMGPAHCALSIYRYQH